jgi:hypothetical protein
MKTSGSSEILVPIYHISCTHTDHNMKLHCHINLKSYVIYALPCNITCLLLYLFFVMSVAAALLLHEARYQVAMHVKVALSRSLYTVLATVTCIHHFSYTDQKLKTKTY